MKPTANNNAVPANADNCYVCQEPLLPKEDKIEVYECGHDTGLLVHRRCMDNGGYGNCRYCGSFIAHPLDYLNEASECDAHAGESVMDEEEEEDVESFLENMNKDG